MGVKRDILLLSEERVLKNEMFRKAFVMRSSAYYVSITSNSMIYAGKAVL
jgi:hypothetical protein